MRKYLYILISFFAFFACNSTEQPTDGYTINGDVQGLSDSKIILHRIVDGEYKEVETIDMTGGKYTFYGKVEMPEMYYIQIGSNMNLIPVFIENSVITIKTNINNIPGSIITGSVEHKNFDLFIEQQKDLDLAQQKLSEEYEIALQENDSAKIKDLDSKFEQLSVDTKEFLLKYVMENNKTVVSPFVVLAQLIYQIEFEQLEEIVNNFDTSLNKSVYVIDLQNRVSLLRSVAIGQPAPNFTLNTPENVPLSLSDFKGKYVMIDFWASWCVPCRRENPNVLKLYNKYHEQGFEVLGVSLDSEMELWKKAIEKDGLPWLHVSDLQRWKNQAAQLYGVNAIPHTVLIDKEGIIIAKNLRGEELVQKLDEIFKQP